MIEGSWKVEIIRKLNEDRKTGKEKGDTELEKKKRGREWINLSSYSYQ